MTLPLAVPVGAPRFRARIATMTAKKERPFSPKHAAAPRVANAAPASTGPITRARLNWIEFSATAFGRSSLSTSVGTSAWYAGPPNDIATPTTSERTRMIQTSTRFV